MATDLGRNMQCECTIKTSTKHCCVRWFINITGYTRNRMDTPIIKLEMLGTSNLNGLTIKCNPQFIQQLLRYRKIYTHIIYMAARSSIRVIQLPELIPACRDPIWTGSDTALLLQQYC
jgi:hypothetical protein